MAVLVATGCGGGRSASSDDREVPVTPSTVVSLSPAITTTLVDLGESDRVVGRTPWCRGVDECPVVGTLEGVDAEVLVALEPSVVLHQPAASGSDPVLLELEQRLGFECWGARLDGVDDVLLLLDRIERLGLASGDRLDERRQALLAVGDHDVRSDDPLAVVLHSVDPVGVAGEDTYLGELARAAGMRNAAGPGGWREWSVEMLVSSEPEVVVVFTGSGMEEAVRGRLEAIEWPRPPAIVIVSNPDAFEPSTRMPEVLADLRRRMGDAGIPVDGPLDPRSEGDVNGDP